MGKEGVFLSLTWEAGWTELYEGGWDRGNESGPRAHLRVGGVQMPRQADHLKLQRLSGCANRDTVRAPSCPSTPHP